MMYKSNAIRQDPTTTNTQARNFSGNIVWSNDTEGEANNMKSSVGFQYNLSKAAQAQISYEVLNPCLLLNC